MVMCYIRSEGSLVMWYSFLHSLSLNLFTCENLVTKICPSLHSIPIRPSSYYALPYLHPATNHPPSYTLGISLPIFVTKLSLIVSLSSINIHSKSFPPGSMLKLPAHSLYGFLSCPYRLCISGKLFCVGVN